MQGFISALYPKEWIKWNVVNFIGETKSVSKQDASFW